MPGADSYDLSAEPPDAQHGRTVHQILDFSVGDRINAKGLDLFVETTSDTDGLLDDAQTGLGRIPHINLSYNSFEGLEQTLLQWDFDDSDASVTVVMVGHFNFGWSAMAQA